MKYIYLLFATLIFSACSKDEVYGPFNLKDGQVVELAVSHRYGAIDDRLTLLPQNTVGDMSLYYFNEREPGYNYTVKARMVAPETPPQDGPAYHLEFIEVISKEKYEGNDSFDISLIQSFVPGGPVIMLRKIDDQYYYLRDKLFLTANDDQIAAQLEEIWQYNKDNFIDNDQPPAIPKWKSIRATVTHDPENFGKGYLVSHLELTE